MSPEIAGLVWKGLSSAVGAYYEVQAAGDQAKADQSAFEFQAQMDRISAGMAFDEAVAIEAAGRREIGRYTLAAGQEKAEFRSRAAGRGVQLGVGSTAEVAASIDLAKEVDTQTLSANAVQRANGSRVQEVNYRARSLAREVSAQRRGMFARYSNPWLGAGASLATSGATIAREWLASGSQ